ncbi:uncharacterized protein LOC110706213 [Chenopodium quinoa]|uniref:uncharacterized protein LOC110706213 n=1 Tax=Chenopodium quinoa TaxID=63459 RepID=UPI000B784A0B|nr:uncharacterized protein LOC110706213 [Chenopodium quinoa]
MATPASPLISPSSDKRYWSALHERVETLLENRKSVRSCSISLMHDGELNSAKKSKADSMLLIRGFDSIASSLSQLTGNIEKALQGARELEKTSTVTEIIHSSSSSDGAETEEDKNQEISEKKGVKRKLDAEDCSNGEGEKEATPDNKKKQKHQTELNLKNVKNLSVAMAAKSSSLARELKSVKSDMFFMQERCALLEEENQRLRDGYGKEDRPDDDDLVRLQLEALLAEKSRLATENANLTRENQCLRQLVEYHQFASEDLSASYEQVIQGLSLDFSSPTANDKDNLEDLQTPRTSTEVFEFPSCLDDSFAGEQVTLTD